MASNPFDDILPSSPTSGNPFDDLLPSAPDWQPYAGRQAAAAQQVESELPNRLSGLRLLEHPSQIPTAVQQHPFLAPLSMAFAPAEAGIGALSDVGLALQAGQPGRIPHDVGETLAGRRPAMFSDVLKASAVPGLSHPAVGLATDIALMHGVSPESGLAKVPGISQIGQATRLASNPAIGVAEGLSTAGKTVGKVVSGSGALPKAAETIREGVSNFRQQIATKFHPLYEEALASIKGSQPAGELYDQMQAILQKFGLLDEQGNLVRDRTNLSAIQKKVLDVYDTVQGKSGIPEGQAIVTEEMGKASATGIPTQAASEAALQSSLARVETPMGFPVSLPRLRTQLMELNDVLRKTKTYSGVHALADEVFSAGTDYLGQFSKTLKGVNAQYAKDIGDFRDMNKLANVFDRSRFGADRLLSTLGRINAVPEGTGASQTLQRIVALTEQELGGKAKVTPDEIKAALEKVKGIVGAREFMRAIGGPIAGAAFGTALGLPFSGLRGGVGTIGGLFMGSRLARGLPGLAKYIGSVARPFEPLLPAAEANLLMGLSHQADGQSPDEQQKDYLTHQLLTSGM